MNRTLVRMGVVLSIGLAAAGVCACGSSPTKAATEASSGCRYDHRRALPDHIRQPEARVVAWAKRILRRAARSDRRSGLVQVLAGSGYRIEDGGTWSTSDKPLHGGRPRVIGAAIDIALDRPHRVDAIVAAAGDGWPRKSRNYRYSRRYGYVEHRAHLTSPSLTGVEILVDVRRGKVAEVGPGPSGEVTLFEPVAGHCPLPPAPPE
jgi:hypothetical protein